MKARWLGAMALCSTLAGACGGMSKLNDLNDNGIPDDEEQIEDDYDGEDEEEHVDVAVVKECPQLCATAIVEMGDVPGCEITCGVDILPSFEGAAGVNVAILLSAGAAGDFEAGQSCDLVTVCETACGELLGDCMDALPQPPDPLLLGLCTEEYRECLIEEDCYSSRVTCEDGALALLQECIDEGTPTDECEESFIGTMCGCATIYNSCVGSSEDACPDEEAMALISPPIQTGPGRFRVSRAFIDRELASITAMSTETFVLPVFDRNDRPLGYELRSIRSEDALYALGLRNRDVLLAVNERSIVKGQLAENLLSLRTAIQLRLSIRRGGTVRQLTYDIVPK